MNFNGGKAIMDSAKTPYHHLSSGALTYVSVSTAYGESKDRNRWNNIIADRFSCMLDRWPEFDWHMRQHQFWMLFEGYAPIVFDQGTSWKFCSLPSNAVLVPNDCASILDDRIPWVVVRQAYRAHELWNYISDEASADKAGWNVAAVKRAIINAGNGSQNSELHGHNWEWWQDRLKNQELETSFTGMDVIRCAHVLNKEYRTKKERKEGKGVSHFIITEGDPGESDNALGKAAEAKGGFLFKSPNRFKKYTNFLNVIFQNDGDGTWHSVRGKMMDAFKHIEIQNRLRCRTLDGAFISSSLVLQSKSATSKDQMQITQVGATTWLPPGVEAVQSKLDGSMSGPMAMDRLIGNDLASNLGQFSPRNMSRDDGRGEMPTAEHIRSIENKEAYLSDGEITIYYGGLDCLYDETFRRAVESDDEDAERFRNECYERGVPPEALKNMDWIRANRLSGYGSKRMRQQASKEMMEVVGMLPEEGKSNWLDDYIAVVESPDKIDRYNPKVENPTSDDAWAAMENSMIERGDMPVMFSGQNDVNHLQIHLAAATEQLRPLQEAVAMDEADPESVQQAVSYIETLAPHCEQHIARLEADNSRKDKAALFSQTLKNLVSFHGKLRGVLIQLGNEQRQAAMEDQQANSLGALDQAKLQSVQSDIVRKDMKAQADIQLKTTKAVNSERLNNWKAQQANRREALKTAGQLSIDRARKAQASTSSN